MKRFKVLVLDEAENDFIKAIEYYKTINLTVAKKFYKATNTTLNDLKKNPFYQIRYDDFRMKMIKGFPYVLHFTVDEKLQTAFVYGIRNTYLNPDVSYIKK